MSETIHQKIQKSPFRNTYWFARYLMNTDQYGALGKNKECKMLEIINMLEAVISQKNIGNDDKLKISKNILLNEIKGIAKEGTKTQIQAIALADTFEREIETIDDVIILCITLKLIIVPITKALSRITSDDTGYSEKIVSNILTLGEEKAGIAITTWDYLGEKGCLDEERTVIVEEFLNLIDNMSSLTINHDAFDDSILMTAFVQEFERRLGQKRKSRGGHSLETVTSFLFDYYKFKSATAPLHFSQDLEVDKWFKCKDGWSIGISCKRTLRERWKQLSQADRGTLSRFKIKELWHLITYDKDLTDDKIVRLGEQGQFFYLLDTSEIYIRCSKHAGMSNYVRPLSRLIGDIRENMTGSRN